MKMPAPNILNECAGQTVSPAEMPLSRRTLSVSNAIVSSFAVSGVQIKRFLDRRDCYAVNAHSALDVVLGRIFGHDADARPIRPPIPKAAWPFPLRNRFPNPAQTPCRNGSPRTRHDWGEYPVEMDECLVGGRSRGTGRGIHDMATVIWSRRSARAQKWGDSGGSQAPNAPQGHPTEENGLCRATAVADDSGPDAKNLLVFALENVAKGTVIRTDAWRGYEELPLLGFNHDPLILAGDPDKQSNTCQ